ncbi:hypothetical protein EDC04DRAFT_2745011 [Pisolithus marmoratus]|nr:hypothetical protein EDC04DRAFT_2745011 [Pisolithus marmoratus]
MTDLLELILGLVPSACHCVSIFAQHTIARGWQCSDTRGCGLLESSVGWIRNASSRPRYGNARIRTTGCHLAVFFQGDYDPCERHWSTSDVIISLVLLITRFCCGDEDAKLRIRNRFVLRISTASNRWRDRMTWWDTVSVCSGTPIMNAWGNAQQMFVMYHSNRKSSGNNTEKPSAVIVWITNDVLSE